MRTSGRERLRSVRIRTALMSCISPSGMDGSSWTGSTEYLGQTYGDIGGTSRPFSLSVKCLFLCHSQYTCQVSCPDVFLDYVERKENGRRLRHPKETISYDDSFHVVFHAEQDKRLTKRLGVCTDTFSGVERLCFCEGLTKRLRSQVKPLLMKGCIAMTR